MLQGGPRDPQTLLSPEFLKAAIMQSHDGARYLIILANYGLKNEKQEKKNWHFFPVLVTIWTYMNTWINRQKIRKKI